MTATVLQRFEPTLREALLARGLNLQIPPDWTQEEGRECWCVWRRSEVLGNVGGPLFLAALREDFDKGEPTEGALTRLANAFAENWEDDCLDAEREGREVH